MNILVSLKPDQYPEISHHSYGTIAEIDWESKKLVRRAIFPCPSYKTEHAFAAPLVGGVCMLRGRLPCAFWNCVVEIDYETFEVSNVVSHPYMVDLHGISTDGKDVWVASTGIDAVLCLDGGSLELK